MKPCWSVAELNLESGSLEDANPKGLIEAVMEDGLRSNSLAPGLFWHWLTFRDFMRLGLRADISELQNE